MLILPHTVEVRTARARTGEGGRALPHSFHAAMRIPIQITPAAAGTVYAQEGVELSRPHIAITRAAFADRLAVGDRLVGVGALANRRFVVASAPKIFVGIGPADHVEITLEELQFDDA